MSAYPVHVILDVVVIFLVLIVAVLRHGTQPDHLPIVVVTQG
jgi:hypothetical protein